MAVNSRHGGCQGAMTGVKGDIDRHESTLHFESVLTTAPPKTPVDLLLEELMDDLDFPSFIEPRKVMMGERLEPSRLLFYRLISHCASLLNAFFCLLALESVYICLSNSTPPSRSNQE
jgi:hypothetical protein